MSIAKEAPDYLTSSVIYQMNCRVMTPEGTLNAAAKMLPHLAEIGVDIVYLTPFVGLDTDMDKSHWSDRQNKSGVENPKNPYRIADYFNVDEEFGTNDDFRAFVSIAHQLGLSVMMDLVYFHCGPTAVFLKGHPDFVKRNPDGSIAFGQWHFPILDFDNPELREYLLANMLYWVEEYDVDGYRCDVADAVPLDFWENAVNQIEEIKPDFIMLAEGDKKDSQLLAFNLNYCFPWGQNVRTVLDGKNPASYLRKMHEDYLVDRPEGVRCMRYLDNHDIANDEYDNRLEKRLPAEANEAALFLNFTVDGVPLLYNGQEIADATRHILFGNRFTASNNCINWAKALMPEGQARLEFIKKLTELKHSSHVLAHGGLEWIDNSTPDAVLSFLRACNDDCDCDDDCDCEDEHGHDHDHCDCETQLIVAVNLSDKPLVTKLDLQVERGTLLNTKYAKDANYKLDATYNLSINMLPYGCIILEF